MDYCPAESQMDALCRDGWGDEDVGGGSAVVPLPCDRPLRRLRGAAVAPQRGRAAGRVAAMLATVTPNPWRRRWLLQRGEGCVLRQPWPSPRAAVATMPVFLSHLPLLALALALLICATCVSPVRGAQPVTLSSRTEGDTRGASTEMYPFPRDLRVTGGQAIFSFSVPAGADLDVHITTCDAVGFDSRTTVTPVLFHTLAARNQGLRRPLVIFSHAGCRRRRRRYSIAAAAADIQSLPPPPSPRLPTSAVSTPSPHPLLPRLMPQP